MGVHRPYFSSVERGERKLTMQTLEKVAEFLGVDPRTLLDKQT
jgi:transcriptional regulator with XRE-family HTH domain